MKDGTASEHRAVLHLDMTGQKHVVGHHHSVSDRGIMAHVSTDHQEVVIPDTGCTTLLRRTMDRGVFSDHVVIANFDKGRSSPLEGKILGIRADDRPVADGVAGTHPHVPANHGAGLNPASSPITAPASTMAPGPTSTSSARDAAGSTKAVGWMEDIDENMNYEG